MTDFWMRCEVRKSNKITNKRIWSLVIHQTSKRKQYTAFETSKGYKLRIAFSRRSQKIHSGVVLPLQPSKKKEFFVEKMWFKKVPLTSAFCNRAWHQGLVSRKSRELFGPQKPIVKLQPAYSVKLVFSYVAKAIKMKITTKCRASRRLRFKDRKRIMPA